MVANMLKDPSNVRVIIFSLEMSVVEVLMRMLSIISQVKSRKFEIPELLEDADMAKITKAAEWLSARQLVVIDKHCNMSDIEMISKKYKPNVIIVDFVQHMRFSAREMEHFALSLSTRVKELKVLAKQLNAVVWMASQISREYERGGHRLPVMSDLKESGGLEECADFVCFLHWPFKLSPDTDYENDAHWEEDTKKIVSLVVAKARFGATGIIKLLFDYEYTTFKNMYLGKEDYNVEN
jgi:replicative DNA helicase